MSSSSSPQRRDAYRVTVSGRARVQRASGETTEFELRDLSVGGARLLGPTRLDPDEPVTVEIPLGEEVVELGARVARLDVHGCSVRFGALARAVENRISRYLTEEQRGRVRPRD